MARCKNWIGIGLSSLSIWWGSIGIEVCKAVKCLPHMPRVAGSSLPCPLGAGWFCGNRLHINNVKSGRLAKNSLGLVWVFGWFGWSKHLLNSAFEIWQSLGFYFLPKFRLADSLAFNFAWTQSIARRFHAFRLPLRKSTASCSVSLRLVKFRTPRPDW